MCGGSIEGVGTSSECFTLPYHGKSWLRSPDVPALNEKRRWASSFMAENGEVWIAGGWNGSERLSSIEVRNKDGSWTFSSVELPVKVAGHCMVSIDENQLLLIGGHNWENGYLASVYLYDKRTNIWERKEDMAERRTQPSCSSFEGKVIVSGGRNSRSLASSEIFDPVTNSWAKGPELPSATEKAKTIKVGEVTYHIGGESSRTDILRLDRVNSTTLKFNKVGSLSKEKFNFDVLEIKISKSNCNGWQ